MNSDSANELARLRISDADRDRAASVLSHALAEGRLTADEHSERLDAIYAAKTHADIAPIVSDLPGAGMALEVPAGSVVSSARHTELDLREAVLPGKEITINAVCVLRRRADHGSAGGARDRYRVGASRQPGDRVRQC
jgi:hypothetical protein